MDEFIDKSRIRALALEKGVPITRFILKFNSRVHEDRFTLIAVNANSILTIKSALATARRYNAPIIFITTLNQVDLDGGYTGWNQYDFVKIVLEVSKNVGFDGPIILASDHYGPWLKDKQVVERWSYDECIQWLQKSIEACIDAGYDLLHIDMTRDIELSKDKTLDVDKIVARTVEMIEFSEEIRKSKGLSKIDYEVGTEEVSGGLTSIEMFEEFLIKLRQKLVEKHIDVWPCFVVGDIGTSLYEPKLDFNRAMALVNIAGKYDCFVKGHYTDFVRDLELYPKAGVGGANVGPKFTQVEFDALERLEKIEQNFLKHDIQYSKFMKVLYDSILRSGRWKKWLFKYEEGKEFEQLSKKRKKWLLQTGARYVWMEKDVRKAREQLYNNLKLEGIDGEKMVLNRLNRSMSRFFKAFNLINLNSRITKLMN
ncbi:MAG: class II D-tagatose-bisphosphate aldolase, non-catalytic subunit [Nitrososphaeria archaeon]|nr:class II D-tagatose-bisphosphate aldolase, non-catalytic subunit [Nitrososphaeria archaeon]